MRLTHNFLRHHGLSRLKSENPASAAGLSGVAPDLVLGTLQRGFALADGLREPFHRAIYMMFLVSEVPPFKDGNGRIARIMMNAELVAQGERRIIIPTIFRSNYLRALKALTHNRRTDPLIRSLDFAQRYTAAIDFTSYERAIAMLTRTHAFMEFDRADAEGFRLTLPD